MKLCLLHNAVFQLESNQITQVVAYV